MSVFIIKDKPIAFVKDLEALVVTDLHIGVEIELRRKGINIPSQSEKFVEMIYEAKEKTNAKNLIILGDLKHKVPVSSVSELEKVKYFLEEVSKRLKVTICKGNHDDLIEKIVEDIKEVKVYGARGFKMGDYGFFHGHAWPFSSLWEAKTWIVGHLQAFVETSLKTKKKVEKVVIKGVPKVKRGNLKEIIILPSLNDFVGGIDISKFKPSGFLFERLIDFEKSSVYLLDNTFLGNIKEITEK